MNPPFAAPDRNKKDGLGIVSQRPCEFMAASAWQGSF
jgi:hypothetical protein